VRRTLTLSVLLLVLGGCASKENIESALQGFKGSSIYSAIAHLGTPTSHIKLPSLHKYSWTQKGAIELPSNDYKYDSDGDRYYAPEDNEIDYECTIEIYTNLEFEITSARVSGDNLGCTGYSSDLKDLHKKSNFNLVQRLSSRQDRNCFFICDNGKDYVSSCNNDFINVNGMRCKKDREIK